MNVTETEPLSGSHERDHANNRSNYDRGVGTELWDRLWNSLLSPQYWVWSSTYVHAIEEATQLFDFTTIIWFMRHKSTPFAKLVLFHLFNLTVTAFVYLWSDHVWTTKSQPQAQAVRGIVLIQYPQKKNINIKNF